VPEPLKHAEKRNWFETIARFIPGFRGYMQTNDRREADYLQRKWLSERLERAKSGLEAYARVLVDMAAIDQMTQIDRIRAKLERAIARIKGADRGYSSLFGFVRIKTDLLDQVYQHDVSLMEEVDEMAQTMEELPTVQDPPAAVVADLNTRIDSIQRKIDERSDLLNGLGMDEGPQAT